MTETINKTEVAEAATENIKPYTFRKLASSDVFLMFRILGKIGFKEFKGIFSGDNVEMLLSSFKQTDSDNAKALTAIGIAVGFDAIDIILNNIPKCEEEIYQLLAQTSNMKIGAIKADALLFTEMLVDFVKKDEFPDFIKVVSRLFK